jgi:hypothetical protein
MKAIPRLVGQLTVLALMASVCGCARSVETPVFHKVRALAGRKAIDCGNALFAGMVAKNNACAIGAATEGAAFYIRWTIHDDQTTSARGIAMNPDGQMFMVSTSPNAAPGQLETVSCKSPHLAPDPTVTSVKVLTCTPND